MVLGIRDQATFARGPEGTEPADAGVSLLAALRAAPRVPPRGGFESLSAVVETISILRQLVAERPATKLICAAV